MKQNDELLKEVSGLLFLSLDGSISEEQFAKLQGLLSSDEAARAYYFDLMHICAGLNDTEGILGLDELLDCGDSTGVIAKKHETL